MEEEGRTKLCNVLPPLDPEVLGWLRASIAADGVLFPIVVDEGGVVIDGHHRLAVSKELSIECPDRLRWVVCRRQAGYRRRGERGPSPVERCPDGAPGPT